METSSVAVNMNSEVEERKAKMLKVWSRSRTIRKSVIASSFEELCDKVIQKFEMADPEQLTFCLELDGTEIDTDVFHHISEGTCLIYLNAGESWIPDQSVSNEHGNGGREEAMEARLGTIMASIKAPKRGKPKKTTRRLHFGWVHYNFKERRFIQVRNAGQVTREVDKNLTYTQAMELMKDIYFPQGKSERGKLRNMVVTVGKIDGTRFDEDQVIEASVLKVYLQTKLNIRQATVYTDSDSDSDLYDPQLCQPPKKKLHLRKKETSGGSAAIGAPRTLAATSSPTSLEISAVPGPSGVVTTIGYPAALQGSRISATTAMTPVRGLSGLPTALQTMSEVLGGSPFAATPTMGASGGSAAIGAPRTLAATSSPTSLEISAVPGPSGVVTTIGYPAALQGSRISATTGMTPVRGLSGLFTTLQTMSDVPEQFTTTDTPTIGASGGSAAIGAPRTLAATSSPTSLEISAVPGSSGVVTTIGYPAALQGSRISATTGMTPVRGLSGLSTTLQTMSDVPEQFTTTDTPTIGASGGSAAIGAPRTLAATSSPTSLEISAVPGSSGVVTTIGYPAALQGSRISATTGMTPVRGLSGLSTTLQTMSDVPEQFTTTDTPTIGASGGSAAIGAPRTLAATSSPTSLEISAVPGSSGVVTTIGYPAALQGSRISATTAMTPARGLSGLSTGLQTMSDVPEQFTTTDTPTISFRSPEYSVCNICCERPLDASIDPCRHRMCLVCGLQIQALGQKCPICRGIIRNVVSLN